MLRGCCTAKWDGLWDHGISVSISSRFCRFHQIFHGRSQISAVLDLRGSPSLDLLHYPFSSIPFFSSLGQSCQWNRAKDLNKDVRHVGSVNGVPLNELHWINGVPFVSALHNGHFGGCEYTICGRTHIENSEIFEDQSTWSIMQLSLSRCHVFSVTWWWQASNESI